MPKSTMNKAVKPTEPYMMLPELVKTIMEPNRVTTAQYDYNLIQTKIFTAVLYELQDGIKARIKGHNYDQLDLFKIQGDKLSVKIALRDICPTKANYDEVRKSAKKLASIVVRMPGIDPFTGRLAEEYKGLMSVVVPEDYQFDRYIVVNLEKDIAKRLMEIDRNKDGKPSNFTTYDGRIILKSKVKYTGKIYKFISSWKNRGGKIVDLNLFKTHLGLQPDKYSNYYDFKKRIIIPAGEELFEKADCWFDYNNPSFEIRTNRLVTGLHFKIIMPEQLQLNEIRKEQISNMLRTHFSLKEEHFVQIKPIINNSSLYDKLQWKLLDLNDKIKDRKNTEARVIHIPNFVVASIIKEFS